SLQNNKQNEIKHLQKVSFILYIKFPFAENFSSYSVLMLSSGSVSWRSSITSWKSIPNRFRLIRLYSNSPRLSVLNWSLPSGFIICLCCSRKERQVNGRFSWRFFGHGSETLRYIRSTSPSLKYSVLVLASSSTRRTLASSSSCTFSSTRIITFLSSSIPT